MNLDYNTLCDRLLDSYFNRSLPQEIKPAIKYLFNFIDDNNLVSDTSGGVFKHKINLLKYTIS